MKSWRASKSRLRGMLCHFVALDRDAVALRGSSLGRRALAIVAGGQRQRESCERYLPPQVTEASCLYEPPNVIDDEAVRMDWQS